MKKVLSMILVLAMMLSLVTLTSVTSTAEEGATNVEPQVTGAALTTKAFTASEGKATVDGVEYYVITQAAELEVALTTPNRYILADDLNLNGEKLITEAGDGVIYIADGVVINGNGHAITNFLAPTGGAFKISTGAVTFENISLIATLNDALFAVAAGATLNLNNVVVNAGNMILASASGCTLNFTNCTKQGNISRAAAGIGGYIGAVSGQENTIQFKNCINEGNVQGNGNVDRFGGFIGNVNFPTDSEISFKNCKNTGAITARHYPGGFVGDNCGVQIEFENCYNSGTVTGRNQHTGGFVGRTYTGMLEFYNCHNTGSVSGNTSNANNNNNAGGFVGYVSGDGAGAKFENCTNSGAVSCKKDYTGGFVGKTEQPVSFDGCYNSATVTGNNYTGGFVGHNTGKVTFDNCHSTETANVKANNTCAGGFIAYSNAADTDFKNCTSAGTVTCTSNTTARVGGFVGLVNQSISFTSCENSAAVVATGKNYAGGFVGHAQNPGTEVSISDCTNKGAVTGADGVSAFVGMVAAQAVTLDFTNCGNSGALTGTSNVGAFVGNNQSTSTPSTTITVEDTEDATGAPIFAGAQETTPADGETTQNVRLLAAINSLKYDEAGFKVTVSVNGQTGEDKVYTHAASNAYLSAKAGTTVVTPGQFSNSKYLYTLTFTDVPTSADDPATEGVEDLTVVFTVQTYGRVGENTEYGAAYTVTYVNGVFQSIAPVAN